MGSTTLLKEKVSTRVAQIREDIAEIATGCGRDPAAITLMAVTKFHPFEAVTAAAAAGITCFGESRVQEAAGKYISAGSRLNIHLIGHLQRNKVKSAASLFTCVQSIDKLETVVALDRAAEEQKRIIDILLEVNTSAEDSKSGYRNTDALRSDLDSMLGLRWVRLRGLMTIAPYTNEETPIRRSFAQLRSLFDEIRGRVTSQEFDTISMGMTNDFKIAIEEGSTLVRIGTAIFGERNP